MKFEDLIKEVKFEVEVDGVKLAPAIVQDADKGDDYDAEQDLNAFSFHVDVPPKILSSFVFFI